MRCLACGSKNACQQHHIVGRDREHTVTLCDPCHRAVHRLWRANALDGVTGLGAEVGRVAVLFAHLGTYGVLPVSVPALFEQIARELLGRCP